MDAARLKTLKPPYLNRFSQQVSTGNGVLAERLCKFRRHLVSITSIG